MPAAYSYDLRKKAMEALDEGESKQWQQDLRLDELLYGSGSTVGLTINYVKIENDYFR